MNTEFTIAGTADLLDDWPDLWRYPKLAVALGNGRLDPAAAYDAVLQGLAHPMANPEDAARQLAVEEGEFDVAERLFDDESLRGLIDDARRQAEADIRRRMSGLIGRAQRVGAGPTPPNEVVETGWRSRAAAEQELDRWESRITEAEKRRREEIERLVTEKGALLPDARRDSIQHGLDLGAFDAAQRIAADPSAPTSERGGPGEVVRNRRWRLNQEAENMIGWYFGDADPPPEFHTWRPPEDDGAAWEILRALRTAAGCLDHDSGEAIVKALHRLFGAADVPVRVEEGTDGVSGALAGLSDHPLLPQLALPHRLPLWISTGVTPPPQDMGRPTLWLVTGRRLESGAIPGIAVWDASSIFHLVAPSEYRGPALVSARRINALRMICAQLRLNDLIADAYEVELGERLDLRRQLAWLLDLLGVSAHEAALDLLLYDTSENRVALRHALTALLPDDARPVELTARDVARWDRDAASVEAFRRDVLEALAQDAETKSVLHAALLLYNQYREDTFTADDVEQILRLVEPGEGEPVDQRRVWLPPSYLYVPRALRRARISGLLAAGEGDTFVLEPGGLRDLLAGSEADLESAVRDALAVLTKRRRSVTESVQLRVTLDAIRHLASNHLDSFRKLTREMAQHRAGVPLELAELITNTISSFEQFEDYRRSAQLDAIEGIEDPRPFDIGVLIKELADVSSDANVKVTVEEDQATRAISVFASRWLVKMAIDNLVLNAIQAIAGSGSRKGSIVIRLATDGNRRAVIDIENSGPPIQPDIRIGIERGEPVSTREGEGRGLSDARYLVAYCGGSVELMRGDSPLGGAHFRVLIPLNVASCA